jgi:hypothetical protein
MILDAQEQVVGSLMPRKVGIELEDVRGDVHVAVEEQSRAFMPGAW